MGLGCKDLTYGNVAKYYTEDTFCCRIQSLQRGNVLISDSASGLSRRHHKVHYFAGFELQLSSSLKFDDEIPPYDQTGSYSVAGSKY